MTYLESIFLFRTGLQRYNQGTPCQLNTQVEVNVFTGLIVMDKRKMPIDTLKLSIFLKNNGRGPRWGLMNAATKKYLEAGYIVRGGKYSFHLTEAGRQAYRDLEACLQRGRIRNSVKEKQYK